jgi:hypothetical protein
VAYRSLARATFAVTAVLVVVAIAILTSLNIEGGREDEFSDHAWARVLNIFAFFTILSNIIIGVTCALLARDPQRDSPVFRMFRLTGVLCIAVTGVVYHVALASLRQLDGEALVADQILHTVVPVLAVGGWLAFGPRGLASRDDALSATLVPLAWLAFTLVRGPIVDWYPYPFLDVSVEGYVRVLVNALIVAVLFFVLALGAVALDGWLARRVAPGTAAAASPASLDGPATRGQR